MREMQTPKKDSIIVDGIRIDKGGYVTCHTAEEEDPTEEDPMEVHTAAEAQVPEDRIIFSPDLEDTGVITMTEGLIRTSIRTEDLRRPAREASS